MPIAKITGQGLAAIALSVVLLWACFIGERVIRRHANARTTQVLREIRQMQRQRGTQPASAPLPAFHHTASPTLG
jgi:hypothetical protein